ncbi:MAG: GspE/PulE family protein [Planctomycetes bacterium]|nr:GspE/PulE family protein [Planctomycetota bacterium]MCH9725718.1 GspE/PulE family protein [Planctomycetota bacterium]MCH9777773.1 GspE/PulE family protein [Planctomycetota bacterium]MCH9792804.1 GspE/PulE family protein [Planctomycetota bacterium]MDF1743731.1 GspE/PulE family protein [Gimesia sp.]
MNNNSLLQPKMRLGDLLVYKEYITLEQLESALEEQANGDGNQLLGELLVTSEYCTEEQVLECLALEYRIPYVQLDSRMFDSKIFEILPREFVEKHTVLPLFKVRNVLTVAVAEPTNVFLVDQLSNLTKSEIQIVAASAREIRRMVQTYMPNTNVFVIDDIIDDANGTNVELIEESIDDIGFDVEFAGQSPIIKLVNYIVYNAVREGASDIHIEPTEQQLRIRYRVDGVLQQALEPPVHLAPAVSSRIKIMASLDISERRLPQDGRIHVLMEGRPIDLRVSTLPMPTGEKVVIRILDNRSVNVSLEQLGFSSEVLENFSDQLQKPNGIILVTGPTGSGKSTTLYAALNAVSSIEKNVCTVEDPIEYQLPMINQFQVNEKIGLSFATVLRSLLRQDPDVLMVGEIRDQETGKIAIQAALTGHLVFSTLHTNDAISAIIRLINMGVDDYLIGAAVNMALAQRLCRKICPKCKTQYELPKAMQLAVERMGLEGDEFYKGKGCKKCRNTGFSGRIGVHEILTIDDKLREIITTDARVASVKEYAQNSGMIPLRYDAIRKAKEGLTTIEEALKVSDEGWIPRKSSITH